jgi:hypothetical protein
LRGPNELQLLDVLNNNTNTSSKVDLSHLAVPMYNGTEAHSLKSFIKESDEKNDQDASMEQDSEAPFQNSIVANIIRSKRNFNTSESP